MKEIFETSKFNIIEDDKNYYFFRALEAGDMQDIEKGVITTPDGYSRIRTDRERWEENRKDTPPMYTAESEMSLEEIYNHIRMHYREDTNCISLSSNSNVAVTYGGERPKYVMVTIPKDDPNCYNAGQYMFDEISKAVEREISQLPEDSESLQLINKIDQEQDTKAIREMVLDIYKPTKSEGTYVAKQQQIRQRSGIKSRTEQNQYFTPEQQLVKAKLMAKITILEASGRLQSILPNARDNVNLIRTMNYAFSSSEQIYYGEISGERVKNISPAMLDIISVVQQVKEDDRENPQIKQLETKLIDYVKQGYDIQQKDGKVVFTDGREEIEIPGLEDSVLLSKRDTKLSDKLTIDRVYEITEGKINYTKAKSLIKANFYLSKAKEKTEEIAQILSVLTQDENLEEVIQKIKEETFTVEPEIVQRKNGRGHKLTESVNIDVNTGRMLVSKQEVEEVIQNVSKSSELERSRIIETGGIGSAKKIISNVEREVETVDKNRYYAEAIVNEYNWTKKEIRLSKNERERIVEKLLKINIEELYKKFEQKEIEIEEIPGYIINILAQDGIDGVPYDQLLSQENIEELIQSSIENIGNVVEKLDVERILGSGKIPYQEYQVPGTQIKLKTYQKKAFDNVNTIFANERFASVILPTGAGKTFVALAQMLQNKDKNMVYLAPSTEILHQVENYIIQHVLRKDYVLEKDRKKAIKEVFPNLTLECYQTLLNKDDEELSEYNTDLIILDELHRAGAEEWGKKVENLIKLNPNSKVLGITATPVRDADEKDMAEEIARICGYSEEDIENEKYMASRMELIEAMQEEIVVIPEVIGCEYNLQYREEYIELIKRIQETEDENEKVQLQEKYDSLRRIIEHADGIPELFENNMKKKDGRYIVFLPPAKPGENQQENIQKAMENAEQWFKGFDTEPEMYSVLGEYKDKFNEEQMDRFQTSDSEHVKLLFSVNKLNEGVHVDGINGIIMLRPISKESRILYLQQIGRTIFSLDENKKLKEEDIPQIFDLVNNYIEQDLDRELNKHTTKSDLEKLQEIVYWIEEHGDHIPDVNSKYKVEQRKAITLKRIQEKYSKYLNGIDENLSEKEISEIEEILQLGRSVDLWDIQLADKIDKQGNIIPISKLDRIDKFEVKGEAKKFFETIDEVEQIGELPYLRNAKKIKQWMEERGTTKPPSPTGKDEEEKKLGSALRTIRHKLIKPYNELETEEREEYRRKHPELDEVMEIVEEIDRNNIPAYLRNARKIKEWMEERGTTKPPSPTGKDEEEKKLGGALANIRSQFIKPYMELKTEEEREEYRKKHPELEEVMEIVEEIDRNNISIYLKNARKIKEWMEERGTTKPPSPTGKNEEERKLGKKLNNIREHLIKPYKKLKTEEEREEYRKKHPELEEVMGIIEEIDRDNIPLKLKQTREIKGWMEERGTTKPPAVRSQDEEEKKLGQKLSRIRKNLIKPYMELKTEEEREEYRKKHPELEEVMEIVEEIDRNNISIYLKNARKIKEWMEERGTTKPPSGKSKDEEERKLGQKLSMIREILIKPYKKLKTEEEREEYRKKHPELEEVMAIIEEIDRDNIPTHLRNARKIKEWMEKRETTKPPSIDSEDDEEKKLGGVLKTIKVHLIRPYMNLKTEKEREQYREEHPELDEIMQIVSEMNVNSKHKKTRELAILIQQDLQKRQQLKEARELEAMYEAELAKQETQEV